MAGPAALPSIEAFEDLEFKSIRKAGDDRTWVEIEGPDQADFAMLASGTAVHFFFKREMAENPGLPTVHRWFMLATVKDGLVRGDVVMAVPGPGFKADGARPSTAPVHITGYQNRNAFPDFAEEIRLLSEATKIAMPPNYQGRDLPPAEGASPRP